jgi:hypothetical protein
MRTASKQLWACALAAMVGLLCCVLWVLLAGYLSKPSATAGIS